jgi:hypothetical protein
MQEFGKSCQRMILSAVTMLHSRYIAIGALANVVKAPLSSIMLPPLPFASQSKAAFAAGPCVKLVINRKKSDVDAYTRLYLIEDSRKTIVVAMHIMKMPVETRLAGGQQEPLTGLLLLFYYSLLTLCPAAQRSLQGRKKT